MSTRPITIVYYISSHGYGHAARASQVMAALPPEVKIIVRTTVDPRFIQRESGRKITLLPGRFDVGVLQKDNRTLDWPTTFREARNVMRDASANLMAEVDMLRKRHVDVIACDVPPAPLEAARMAGIPSVVIGNFTWVDIFSREGKHFDDAGELAELWREQYSLATLAIRTPPAFPMDYFRTAKTVEPIARRGKNIRRELLRALGLPRDQKLALLYFGTFGDDELSIPEIPGLTFLAMTKMPSPAVEIDPAQWHFPDVVASADFVIAKPGYGTIGECMANGTPVIYHPRTEFAEYPILRRDIQAWGGGVQIPLIKFQRGNWQTAINAALELKPSKIRSNGAAQAAKLIQELV